MYQHFPVFTALADDLVVWQTKGIVLSPQGTEDCYNMITTTLHDTIKSEKHNRHPYNTDLYVQY